MEKEEKKKGKKIIVIICILLLLIILFLIWWFNRKFDITFKYNNGDPEYVVKVKYLKHIEDKDVKKDLKYAEHLFVGYYETYNLTGKNICKDGFEINKDNNKCISKTAFDFKNTKIKENKTIEAIWTNILFDINPTSKTINVGDNFTITATITGTNDKTVKWSSNDSSIAKVDESGKVTGLKKGTATITAESNGIKRTCAVAVNEVVKEKKVETPKDTGKISLSASKKCIIGNDSVNITATISGNALDKTINWTYPDCYSVQNTSSSVKTLTRNNSCSATKNLNPSVSAKLKNGQSSKTSFTYEPNLSFTVYNNSNAISPSSAGIYYGNNIKIETNINATFSGSYIQSHTSNSVTLRDTSQTKITIKTPCGQSKTVTIYAIIN